jgi:hypothetical protein
MERIVNRAIVFAALVLPCIASPVFPQADKTIIRLKPDSARISISERYDHPGLLRWILLGKNYRKEWSTPILLPVLDVKALQLRIEEMGGGRQTKSLRLIDKDSVEWVLRMIDKQVEKALPAPVRNQITASVVQDMVSAAHPYGPLIIPPLAHATGVTVAMPRFYFVPDDPLLGKYKDVFSNTVCLLERREISAKYTETESTKKMIGLLLQSHHNSVNQEAYLKARLLDMLIGDWDRHSDQWRWVETEADDKKYYLPLPKDRDQAFFYSGGLLVKLVRLLGLRPIVGFTESTSNLIHLNAVAWNLDRLLLNQLSASDWQRIAQKFQKDLTDDVIKEAVKKLPPEIYALNGPVITRKLISRKNSLARDVLGYYLFLSRSLTVWGTDEEEYFHLSGNKDSITLLVTDTKNRKIYQRTFYPRETKIIHLYGLGGDDVFEGTAEIKIQIQMDGGIGKDQYTIRELKKIKVSDTKMDAARYEKILRKQLGIKD